MGIAVAETNGAKSTIPLTLMRARVIAVRKVLQSFIVSLPFRSGLLTA
jgi:hypothetical protein